MTKEIFTERLNYLFDTITKPNGQKYSPEEIQVATNGAIKSSYIYRLLNGASTNPSIEKVKVLSSFFGVEVGFLIGEDQEIDRISFDIRDRLNTMLGFPALLIEDLQGSELESLVNDVKAVQDSQKELVRMMIRIIDLPKTHQAKAKQVFAKILEESG